MRPAPIGLTLGFTIISATMFIVMSILFFFINVWIIKVGAGFAGYSNLSGDWVVMSAGILSAASTLAAALRR
ncbi:hypothetical protein KO361_03090 [Candidatus Woesearchaeota archaeon]|jgi:uncharacterized membrane protein HdeD (DUF308 family)|nr:hypothetical protein [Candidatus Woesearchaeota archaeon]